MTRAFSLLKVPTSTHRHFQQGEGIPRDCENFVDLRFPTLVKDLFEWEVRHLSSHPLFRRLSEDEKQSDPVVEKLFESSEEGQKVSLIS